MLSGSDLRIVHAVRLQVVIVLGRYGNMDSNFGDADGVRCSGGLEASELLDWERTWSFRGALGFEPPAAADAAANMTAASVDHFS